MTTQEPANVTVLHAPLEDPLSTGREVVLDEAEIGHLARRFDGVDNTMALLEWLVETFGDRYILASSWQHAIIVDHLSRITHGTNVRVCELDTGLLFPETYETRRRIIERYGINVISMRPRLTVEQQDGEHGPELWKNNPDLCCHMRKVIPLRTILSQHDAWITGLRRESSATRKDAAVIEFDRKHRMVKVNPLAAWTRQDVWRYILNHDVPYNPLLDNGYPSIGCFPCTRMAGDSGDERAGRWAGTGKTECGIH